MQEDGIILHVHPRRFNWRYNAEHDREQGRICCYMWMRINVQYTEVSMPRNSAVMQ